MSSVVISGDSSGTVSLTVPSVAGTNTATLPAATGTVMVSGNMPAFSAYATANQSIPSTTFTKIQLPFEVFDTNNAFDATTNYRFTPLVAGYYQINGGVASTTTGLMLVSIFKNGSEVIRGNQILGDSTSRLSVVTSVIYCNGSTDYIELYFYQTLGTAQNTSGSQATVYMNGVMVRAA